MVVNVERINPVKRSKILKGLTFVENKNKDGVIQKIILFGSAVSGDCSKESDIDLCLVSDYTAENPVFFSIFGGLPIVMDDSCDIVVYQKLKGNLKEEIDKKGVVIYEFESN